MTWKEKTVQHSRHSTLHSSLLTSKNTRANNMYLLVVLPDKPMYYIEDYNDPEERNEVHEW